MRGAERKQRQRGGREGQRDSASCQLHKTNASAHAARKRHAALSNQHIGAHTCACACGCAGAPPSPAAAAAAVGPPICSAKQCHNQSPLHKDAYAAVRSTTPTLAHQRHTHARARTQAPVVALPPRDDKRIHSRNPRQTISTPACFTNLGHGALRKLV